jgi:hypothetical protein
VGLGDVFKGLFSRRDAPVEPLALLPREVEVAREVSTWRTGTLANIDGYLILTTARLVLASDESGDTVPVLTWPLPGSNLRLAAHPQDPLPGGVLAGAAVGAESSLVSPPTLVVVDTTGQRVEIGILANRLTPNLSHANSTARDRMVAAIRTAISTASAHRPRPPHQATEPDEFSWFSDP